MTELDGIVTDARERLMAARAARRARDRGLPHHRLAARTAVGRRRAARLLNIHYGAEPSPLELRRIVRAYGPGVLPDAEAGATRSRASSISTGAASATSST